MRNNKYSEYIYSEKLKMERCKRNIKLREMSNKLGYNSHVSYKNIEDGVVEPKITVMLKIADILEKPVTYFFNLTVQKS